MCKYACSPLVHFSLISLKRIFKGKRCYVHNFNTLWDILIIFTRCKYQVQTVTFIPFKIFLIIFGRCIYQIKKVHRV